MIGSKKSNLEQVNKWGLLMQKAQQGDNLAYKHLLQLLAPVIKKYLMRRLFDQDAAEDITQEALIAIHRARHTYQPELPFDRWLYSITRHKMIDVFRKKYRDQQNNIEFETFLPILTNSISEDDADVQKALDQLPAKQKELIKLAKVDGYTALEIGLKVGMTETAVKVSIHRSLIKMREWLIHNGY